MATEDEAREADETGVQVEAVDLGTVHLQTHPEGKLTSIMEIKNMGEIFDSTEGKLKIPEDQVLVEAPSEVQLPPEHNLNGETSSLKGYTEKEEKISNEQAHENDQEEAELGQSNGIKKEEVTDGLSHAESRPEDSCLLKHKKDEEPKGDDQQDLDVTGDDNLVQEDTMTADNAIERTDYGQQEPEKANENIEPGSITNNANAEVVAEASTGLQAPVEPHMNDSDAIPETTDEKTEAEEPANAECVVHPEAVAKVEDQQSQQADIIDEDMVQEVNKCEEEPESEAHEPTVDAQGVLNQESAEETDDSTNGNIEETAHQSNMAVPKEITPENESTTTAPPVNTQVKNQESLERIEDAEAEIQQSSGFEDAIPEDQPNLGVTMDNDTVQEDTLQDPDKKDDDQQDQDQEPEKAKEDTQPASMANISYDEVVPKAPSEVQTPGEPNLDNADSVPDNIHGNTEIDEQDKAHTVVHPEQKESFPEDASTAEPIEEVVKVDQQIQQADATDAELVQEEVPKSEHFDEPATDALEGLNQEFQEETEGPVNEKTEAEEPANTAHPEAVAKVEDQKSQQADTIDADVVQEVIKCEEADVQGEDPRSEGHEPTVDAQGVLNQESTEETDDSTNGKIEETADQSNIAILKETKAEHEATTTAPPVNTQVKNQESLEEIEDAEAEIQQSSGFEDAIPEDQPNLGVTMDNDTVQEETVQDLEQKDDDQQDQDLEPKEAKEITQPASMANISHDEVVPEAPSEVQTPGEPNLENADSVPNNIHGDTETDEPDKAHAVVHPEQKESFPEDTSTEEPTEEVVKVEDQQIQQADAMDAEMVQEEVPKSEHADESAQDALEGLNQECAEETDVPVNEKTEESEHKSNMLVPEETMPEHDAQMSQPPLDIQEQSQEALGDAEAVDNEAETQQSSVAFEETTPEDHVTSTETCSEIQHVHHVEPEEINGPGDAKYKEITNMSNTENSVEENILQSEPTTDTQPVQELEQIESKSTGIHEMNEASDQIHANDLTQEDATATSESQVPETEEELKNIEATEAQEISKHDHVTPSKELALESDSTADEPHNGEIQQNLEQNLVEVKDHEETISNSEDTVEDNVTAEEPIWGSQEVDNAESTEETNQNIAENIAEVSDVAIVDEVIEQNVQRTADIAEMNKQEHEPEETKSTEPVESEKASDQRNAALFDDSAQEENTQENEMQKMESVTEIKEIEPTELEAVSQESNACISEEPSPEDYIKQSQTICDNQEVNITESAEVIDSHKDIITGEISGQSNMVSAGELAEESNVPEGEQPADIKAVEELGSEEKKNTEIEEVNETSHEMNPTVFQTPTQENNPANPELHKTTEVRNIEATEEQRNTHQRDDAAQSEGQAAEKIASGPEILEPESVEDNDIEANHPQSTSQQNISTSEEYVSEEIPTEDSVTTEPEVDNQQLQHQESDEIKKIEADRSQEIALFSTLSSVESTSEDDATATEPISDTYEDNSQVAEETEDTENVKSTTAPAEAAAPETESNADTSSVHEAEREETKDTEPIETEDVMTSRGLASETMDIKTVPDESHVATIEELTEDDISTPNAPHADTEPVPEVESVEDTNCTDTTEHPGETHGSTSNEPVPTEENTPETEPALNTQELQSLTSQEIKDTEDDKTDELLDISSLPTPGEEDQASNLPRTEPTPDDQQVQELGLTEETREIEAVETKDHQEHIVSTLEEPAVDSEPNADDQQVQEDRLPEAKDNKAIEAEEASKQSNADNLGSAAEVRNELESDLDSYVQPAQQVELSKDNENSQLVKAEEASGQSNSVALEERTTEDCVASKIDPPLDIKQEQEQEPVEGIKGVDATEAEGDFDTSQVDATEKLASNNNTETTELTYDIERLGDLEVSKEMKNVEAINDGLSHDAAQSEGQATEEIASGPEILEPESIEDNDTEANESQSTPQQNISTSEESVSEEMPTEDSVTTEPEVNNQQRQDQESDEIKEIEADRSQEIALSGTLSSVESTSEDNATATEPISDTHQDNSQVADETENVKSNTAPAEAADPETEANADTSSVHEAAREETKDTKPIETVDVMTSSDLPSEKMDMEPMETEAVPHESQIASIKELTEDDLSTPNVQPEQQVELSKDNENSQLVKAEETSGQSNSVALEERTTEDCVASEIDPPVDIKQEQEQEPVEEIKGVDDTETEGDFDTSQVDAIEKLASNYTETIEPTYDVLQADDLEATKEMKNAEAINDGEQSNIAASEESTPTDNGATPEERPLESNEGMAGNETDNVILAERSNDEIQKSVELKKEDEEIESQNEELQVNEQKHEDNRDDLTMEPLVEYQNIQNEATNRTEDNDAFEAEQTEAAITELLKNEQAYISKESSPNIMDIKVENVKETSEGTEEDDDAKNDNKDEQENAQNDDIVAKHSTNEQGETTEEIRNEEDPVAITQNDESEKHREDKPSTDKANDAVHAIQSSEKETVDELEESKENNDNDFCHDELQTNSGKEKAPQLCSNEPNNVDTKIDDKTPLGEDIIQDNSSIKPREIEEIGENKRFDSTSEPVESSIQRNAEDLNSHHKVEDEKLSMSEQNVDMKPVQETIDGSASCIDQTKQCQEVINADGLLQLETEENSFDKIEETDSHEETETSNTTAAEAGTINDDITDKVGEADGAQSDVSHKTITDTGMDLDVSSVITTPKEESMKDNMEDHNLDLPEHPAQNDNTPEQALCLEETEIEMPLSEELLQTEPGENQIPNERDVKDIQDENQIPKEKNEEDMQYTQIGDAKKGDEQELPVSHFLMNLILGKENSDANGDAGSEAERKQGEVAEDGSCASISKQEENLGSVPTDNMVQDNITFEEEKHELKCPEETQEMVKEQSDDLKQDTERSVETDEDFKRNTHGLEIPAYQDNPQDEISGELLSEEASAVPTKMESRDIDIPSVEQDDRVVDTVCQENMEVSTENENGSLRSNLNDSTYTKASEEDTLGEGQTGLVLQHLPEDKSADAVSEQAPLLIETRVTDANDLSTDTESVQNPVCTKQNKPTESSNVEAPSSPDIQLENEEVATKQDKPTESSNVEATSSPDIQLENEEVAKKEEEQHANITADEVSQPNVESSHHNLQKSTSSEVTSNELATKITEPVRDTQTILAHEKEISEENFQTAVELQADGQNMQINQDQQGETADNETAMQPEKSGESNSQEHQETAIEQRSPKETDEGGQLFLVTKKQDVHETVESPTQTVSVKSNEDQKLYDTKVQERDFNVVSPREASEGEENFVDVTKPEFSTDEEQSPKADAEEKIYDEKIKEIEGIKNFTDESAMKTEAPGAAQKARKKNSLLSGVGSKVKHQLAKVKKAIVGKPGRTKPESPKA